MLLQTGLGPRLARIPVYTAVTLATFDLVKGLFVLSNEAAVGVGSG